MQTCCSCSSCYLEFPDCEHSPTRCPSSLWPPSPWSTGLSPCGHTSPHLAKLHCRIGKTTFFNELRVKTSAKYIKGTTSNFNLLFFKKCPTNEWFFTAYSCTHFKLTYQYKLLIFYYFDLLKVSCEQWAVYGIDSRHSLESHWMILTLTDLLDKEETKIYLQ